MIEYSIVMTELLMIDKMKKIDEYMLKQVLFELFIRQSILNNFSQRKKR